MTFEQPEENELPDNLNGGYPREEGVLEKDKRKEPEDDFEEEDEEEESEEEKRPSFDNMNDEEKD